MQGVLDLVHLSRQTLGDRALETELLELFDGQAAGAVARLCDCSRFAPGARADIAHMLKGSARAIGAFGVAAAADRLEQGLRQSVQSDKAMEDLKSAVAAAREAVSALLSA